jgi:gluconokinase
LGPATDPKSDEAEAVGYAEQARCEKVIPQGRGAKTSEKTWNQSPLIPNVFETSPSRRRVVTGRGDGRLRIGQVDGGGGARTPAAGAFVDADTLHPQANIAKMTAGEPLNDDDRHPWLERVGEWLAGRRDGGVASCSALKRKYRDQLRAHCPSVEFLYLSGSPELIGGRLAVRSGHFMPAALPRSQFDTLEPLGADEAGATVDAGQDVDAIIDAFVAWSTARQHPGT